MFPYMAYIHSNTSIALKCNLKSNITYIHDTDKSSVDHLALI